MQRSRISCRPMFGTTRRRSVTTTGRSDRVESFRPLCYHAYRLWTSEPVFWMSNGDRGAAPLRAFRCQYDAHRTAAISVEHPDTYMSTFTRIALDPSSTQIFSDPRNYHRTGPSLRLTIATLSRCIVILLRHRLAQENLHASGDRTIVPNVILRVNCFVAATAFSC
jgi:hypothetical protein